MHPDNRNTALLRQEAHSIAAKSQEPFVAWSELKRWSLGKGPAATKAAVMEFMEQHGRRPESAAIIPEIARLALIMPESDRREMLELTHRSFAVSAGFERAISPISRAIGSVFPAKKTQEKQAPAPHPDILRMMEQRDLIFHVNRGGLGAPLRSRPDYTALPPTRQVPVIAAGKGHALVHSLSERLRMHGHGPIQHAESYEPATMVRTLPTRGRTAKRSARKKQKPVQARCIARKPVKKAVRKKSRRK